MVRYGSGDQLRYSWHGDLRGHLHERARLVLDDGSAVDVVIGSAFLQVVNGRPIDPESATAT